MCGSRAGILLCSATNRKSPEKRIVKRVAILETADKERGGKGRITCHFIPTVPKTDVFRNELRHFSRTVPKIRLFGNEARYSIPIVPKTCTFGNEA